MKKRSDFLIKHRVIALLIILTITLLFSRMIVNVINPNPTIKGYEIHHFHYGLLLLIIVSLLMLYKKGPFKIHLILTGVSLGLILDEIIFISGKVVEKVTYTSTFSETIILMILFALCVETMYYIHSKYQKNNGALHLKK